MSIEIKSPTFPESVADGTIAKWLKKEGDLVNQDEVIVEIETDKVVLEVLAQSDGVVSKIIKPEGEIVASSELIGEFEESDGSSITQKVQQEEKSEPNEETKLDKSDDLDNSKKMGPAAKKIISEKNIDPENINASGKNNTITKADVINHLETKGIDKENHNIFSESIASGEDRPEKRVPMSRLRSTIAKRLVSVKQETAMLTTFNEVDMLPIKELRAKYGAEFQEEHDVKLGFMGFFVIAAVQALKKFPVVNASIDGNDVVYHGFQDIGVAVSTERGLVVPVIKDADTKSLPEIGREFSNRDHTTVIHSVKTIEKLKTDNIEISNGINTLKNQILYKKENEI